MTTQQPAHPPRRRMRPQRTLLIQWDNGLGRTKLKEADKQYRTGHTGWFAEKGRDVDFDTLALACRVPTIHFKHQRKGADPVPGEHWDLGAVIRFYPVILGVPGENVGQSIKWALRDTAAAGIGLAWPKPDPSRMAIRGYVQYSPDPEDPRVKGAPDDAKPKGFIYPTIVQISTKSHATDVLFGALVDHMRICAVADRIMNREHHPDEIMPWEIALPLGPGEEKSWGSEETVTVTPFASLHPADSGATPDYMKTVYRPTVLAEQAERDLQAVLDWAPTYYAVVMQGHTAPAPEEDAVPEPGEPIEEEPPASARGQRPAAPTAPTTTPARTRTDRGGGGGSQGG